MTIQLTNKGFTFLDVLNPGPLLKVPDVFIIYAGFEQYHVFWHTDH